MSDWHCQQIPNGNNPIVVCERGVLSDAVETLTRRIAVLEQALEPFAVDKGRGVVPLVVDFKRAHETLEANDV